MQASICDKVHELLMRDYLDTDSYLEQRLNNCKDDVITFLQGYKDISGASPVNIIKWNLHSAIIWTFREFTGNKVIVETKHDCMCFHNFFELYPDKQLIAALR